MKTKSIILVAMVVFIHSNHILAQSPITIYTPKGTSLYEHTRPEYMDYQDKLDASTYVQQTYPQATELNSPSATTTYNCHSYAWHMSEGGSTCTVAFYYGDTNESVYWTDNSYVETAEPTASKISYTSDDHSAIQTSTQGIYISKWGDGPLMQHARDYGPYDMSSRKYYRLWPEIIGTFTALCYNSERTFTSNMSIPGSTYTWTKDNSLLDYVSGAGTTSYRVKAKNNSGDAQIQFQMTTPSGESVTRYEFVWVGKPVINSIGGPYYGYTDNTYYFWAVPSYEQRALSTYSWLLSPLNSNYVDDYPTGYAYITFYDPDDYVVLGKADNLCGSTGWKSHPITIDQGYRFSISPNPASEEANIKVLKAGSGAMETEIPDFDIRIYDLNGNLYCTDNKSGLEFTLPVGNLREGSYIVNIKYGEKSANLRLLIKH